MFKINMVKTSTCLNVTTTLLPTFQVPSSQPEDDDENELDFKPFFFPPKASNSTDNFNDELLNMDMTEFDDSWDYDTEPPQLSPINTNVMEQSQIFSQPPVISQYQPHIQVRNLYLHMSYMYQNVIDYN